MHQVLAFLALILTSIVSTTLIKKGIEWIISKSAGQAQKLSHVPSLILGLAISLAFIIAAQAGIIPIPDSLKPEVEQLQTAIYPLAVKAIYDLVNDLKNKLSPPEVK